MSGLEFAALGNGREDILGDVVRGVPHGALTEDSGEPGVMNPALS